MPSDPPRKKSGKVRDSLHFLGQFLRSPGSVGSVTPSSRYLADAIAQDLPVGTGDLVLEYGPGTGPMTAVLAPLNARGVRYLGIELDEGFFGKLQERYPQLDFHCGSVVDIQQILTDRQLPQPKVIISGLPFASFPAELQESILDGVRASLRTDGEFRTFQYVHAYGLPAAKRFRSLMQERFGQFDRSQAVLRNMPPAYVLTYRP